MSNDDLRGFECIYYMKSAAICISRDMAEDGEAVLCEGDVRECIITERREAARSLEAEVRAARRPT